jgi:hypothetical protein
MRSVGGLRLGNAAIAIALVLGSGFALVHAEEAGSAPVVIDQDDTGWKGRGLWTTSGDRAPWLMEGGKGSKPRVVHFQLRPDPLAH